MQLAPSERLLAASALLIPFALLYAIDPAWATLGIGAAAVFALACVADAWLAARRPCPVLPSMEPILRLHRRREGTVTVDLHLTAAPPLFEMALPLPPSITCSNNPTTIRIPDETEKATVNFTLDAQSKGAFPLHHIHIQDRSPLGLWLRRHACPISSELRVYPNMIDERKRLAAHFLRRGAPGSSAFRLIGQGREFERLREYLPGDSYGDIHWKVTAKRNRPVTKLFQVEHTQEIIVAIDAGRLSARQYGEEHALDRYIAATLLLGQIAQQQGDRFGVILFSDRVERFIPPGMGPAHYNACRDAIFSAEPRSVSPSYEELLSFMRLRLRRRAMVLILTDLADSLLAERFLDHVELVSHTHLLTVAMPRPSASAPQLFSTNVETLDELYTQLADHLSDQKLATLTRDLKRRGIPLTLATPGELAATLVRRYFEVKARQQL
jgi:uncharacterized protein (DUF58 family)